MSARCRAIWASASEIMNALATAWGSGMFLDTGRYCCGLMRCNTPWNQTPSFKACCCSGLMLNSSSWIGSVPCQLKTRSRSSNCVSGIGARLGMCVAECIMAWVGWSSSVKTASSALRARAYQLSFITPASSRFWELSTPLIQNPCFALVIAT